MVLVKRLQGRKLVRQTSSSVVFKYKWIERSLTSIIKIEIYLKITTIYPGICWNQIDKVPVLECLCWSQIFRFILEVDRQFFSDCHKVGTRVNHCDAKLDCFNCRPNFAWDLYRVCARQNDFLLIKRFKRPVTRDWVKKSIGQAITNRTQVVSARSRYHCTRMLNCAESNRINDKRIHSKLSLRRVTCVEIINRICLRLGCENRIVQTRVDYVNLKV